MKHTTTILKKYVVLFCIGFGFLTTSCGEKKNNEAATEKAETEMEVKKEQAEAKEKEKEVMEKAEAMKKAEAEKLEKAKMKADSIRQVKEHGHAH